MMKFNQLILALLAIGSASAFAPSGIASTRTFGQSPTLFMADDAEAGGKLVPIKEETVEFTAGILGGVAGLLIGGPVLGAIGAAIANFASKNEAEVGEVVSAVSKTSIETYNYLTKLDTKYEVLTKAKTSLEEALEKVKSGENANAETIEKVEKALASTTSKLKEINDEYDLVGAGVTALGVCGDLVEKALKKAGELNEEYKLTDKALGSVKTAVEQAKVSTAKKVSAPVTPSE